MAPVFAYTSHIFGPSHHPSFQDPNAQLRVFLAEARHHRHVSVEGHTDRRVVRVGAGGHHPDRLSGCHPATRPGATWVPAAGVLRCGVPGDSKGGAGVMALEK